MAERTGAGAGTMLGPCRQLARLGTGGMAEVFLARMDRAHGFTKYVALEKMRDELTVHRELIDLFVEEARTASLLTHPNIVHIHALANVDTRYFMVMEYLEGVPVSSVMVRQLRRPDTFDLPFRAERRTNQLGNRGAEAECPPDGWQGVWSVERR